MIVDLFGRPGCHLCDEAKMVLQAVARRYPFQLREHNVETRPEWERQYGHEVPVVLIEGRKAFKYRVERIRLERYLERGKGPEGAPEEPLEGGTG